MGKLIAYSKYLNVKDELKDITNYKSILIWEIDVTNEQEKLVLKAVSKYIKSNDVDSLFKSIREIKNLK